jgi:hypothetical protein
MLCFGADLIKDSFIIPYRRAFICLVPKNTNFFLSRVNRYRNMSNEETFRVNSIKKEINLNHIIKIQFVLRSKHTLFVIKAQQLIL